MRIAWGIAIIGAFILCTLWLDQRDYGIVYEQGRKDKHAEMMQFISGDRDARIAVVSEKGIDYHPAGVCAGCHGG